MFSSWLNFQVFSEVYIALFTSTREKKHFFVNSWRPAGPCFLLIKQLFPHKFFIKGVDIFVHLVGYIPLFIGCCQLTNKLLRQVGWKTARY